MSIEDIVKPLLPQKKYRSLDYFKMLWHLLPDGQIWKFGINKLSAYFQDSISVQITHDDIIDENDPPEVWQDNENVDPSDTQLGCILHAFAEELNRVDDQVIVMQTEAIPGASNQALEDWELDLGIPEPGTTLSETLSGRQGYAHAKYLQKNDGVLNPAWFIATALSMGFVITIEEFGDEQMAFRVGPVGIDPYDLGSRMGDRLNGVGQQSFIKIHVISGVDTLDAIISIFELSKPGHCILTWLDERI